LWTIQGLIRQYLRQLLEGMGLSCEEAVDGDQALEMLRGTSLFDFMLLDVNMPKMSGLEMREATARGRACSRPMKGDDGDTEADNSYICQALDYGADEFLMKPFTPGACARRLAMIGLACVRKKRQLQDTGKGQ